MTEPVVILTPVFNDWAAFGRLVADLDLALAQAGISATVIAVDDGSSQPHPDRLDATFTAITRVEVLSLRRNLGHQRAIAIGLAFVHSRQPCTVVVMDSDGEDDPRDVPRLLRKLHEMDRRNVVFAERTRRSESLAFRVWYAVYRLAHYILTGRGVRFGNFSAVPSLCLSSLVGCAELWNHYAAGVVKSKQPYCTIPTTRARRLHGQSSMRYVDLVVHGLSAISVYGDLVGVRLLIGLLLLVVLVLMGIAAVVAVRLFTELAIPGWATNAGALLLIMLFQACLFAVFLSFIILTGRQANSFMPIRDYHFFVRETRVLYTAP